MLTKILSIYFISMLTKILLFFFGIPLACPQEDHFFDFSRFICVFLTFWPECFSRRMDRAKIPRISRNLWHAIAKPQISVAVV